MRHAVESNEPLVSAILPKPASDSTATHEHRIGKYLVQGIIGRGGLGVVYKAVNPQVGMTVVIKTIVTDGDASLQALFMREARALAVLNNQNVVKVLDFGEQNGNPYLVTEFLEGSSLESIIKKGISLSLAAKLGIVIDVCNGLADAHNRPQPIIHRDIKPANITVQPDGTAVIINFGLAKIAGETGITKARQIVGSILYMSPEQLRGEDVDNRTDIYSTGVVLFQLLTGVPPFDAEETPVIVSKIVNEPPPPLSKFIRDYPPELSVILSRALSKRRADRYTDANDLKYDLTQLQSRL